MGRFLISLIVLIAFVLAGTILSQRSYAQGQGPPPDLPHAAIELTVACMDQSPLCVEVEKTFCLPRNVSEFIGYIRQCHSCGTIALTGIFFDCV